MIEKINAELVKDILRNREKRIANIHKKMLGLYEQLKRIEQDSAEMASLPGIKADGMPGAKGTHMDLSDVFFSYKRQVYDRNEEVRRLMWVLSEKEELISRVWACFYALEDPFFSILQELYVENQLYQTVEESYEMSHKTFEKYRSEGIELIIRFYESGESVADLIQRHQTEVSFHNAHKKEPKKDGNEYDQISILGYLGADKKKGDNAI